MHIPPGGLRGLPGLRPQGAGRHPLGAVLRGDTAVAIPPGGGWPGGAGREGSFKGDGMGPMGSMGDAIFCGLTMA